MSTTRTEVGRHHFAAGDYVTRFEGSDELEIDTPLEKPGWKARTTPIEFSSAVFPGSTIDFENRLYEIVSILREPSRVHYRLRSWDTRFPVRVQFHYTPEECRKLQDRRAREIAERRIRFWIQLLQPLAGLLPAVDQTRIEKKYAISSSRMTLISALVLLLPSTLAAILFIIQGFGAPPMGASVFHPFYKFGPYFFFESLVRLIHAGFMGEPLGSLPVYIPIEMYRAIRRNLDPNFKQSRFEKMETGRGQIIKAVDRIREIKGEDYDLEVISVLPKPHWNPLTGVRYNGVWYGYLDSQKILKADVQQYRFRLKRAPEGMVFSNFVEYTPDEVQTLLRQKRLMDAGTWVATFSPLWGLLDGQDQKKLHELYGFESKKYTLWTIFGIGIFAFFNFLASAVNLTAHIATSADILFLVASGYLLLETYLRWNRLSQGEPSGSVLGILFQPFAQKLLKV